MRSMASASGDGSSSNESKLENSSRGASDISAWREEGHRSEVN